MLTHHCRRMLGTSYFLSTSIRRWPTDSNRVRGLVCHRRGNLGALLLVAAPAKAERHVIDAGNFGFQLCNSMREVVLQPVGCIAALHTLLELLCADDSLNSIREISRNGRLRVWCRLCITHKLSEERDFVMCSSILIDEVLCE